MAITLFDRKDLGGVSFNVPGDVANLRETPVGYKCSSLRMTVDTDRALFFTKRSWDGRVMIRRGAQVIRHVGRPKDGGKSGFQNDIRSVRLTDFGINVVYHIIRDKNGEWPGGFTSQAAIEGYLRNAHRTMNRVWRPGFIRFDIVRTNVYDNERVFNFRENFSWLRDTRAFSLQQAAVNVFIVNTRRRQIVGEASRLQRLRNAGIAAVALSQGGVRFTAFIAGLIVAHEAGHVLGLRHGSAKGNRSNIMFDSWNLSPNTTTLLGLNRDQVERVHRRMSRSGDGAAFRIE